MKKTSLILTISLVVCQWAMSQNIGINSTGATPNASAMLDVSSTNSGLLIPRVALTAANVASPITAPATSLMVYNTATAGASPNNVIPGYYYWNSARWIPFLVSSTGWTLFGNSGTNSATNFIGTTDAVDVVIRTNNTEKARVTIAGNVGIATTTPAAKLDVAGTYKLGTAGTVLTNIIKTNFNINDATTFSQNTTRQRTVTVTGATVNATVIINPRSAMQPGVGIGWSRVSAANTVIIGFTNTGTTSRAIGNITFDVTIIQ